MVRIKIDDYIDELKGSATELKELDLYSLKKELFDLNKNSEVFDNFYKEAKVIDKDLLAHVRDISSLIKLKNIASELKNKKQINNKLHTLHFNLNILKNTSDIKVIKNVFDVFLHNEDSKIDNIINELNDFKIKIDEIKRLHTNFLPKSLDNKLQTENKYNKHIEQLHSIHKKQKDVLISTIKLFLKLTKKHIKKLNASLRSRKHLPAKI